MNYEISDRDMKSIIDCVRQANEYQLSLSTKAAYALDRVMSGVQ